MKGHPQAENRSMLGLDTDLSLVLHRSLLLFERQQLAALAADADAPLTLTRLASRGQITAAHIHVMRHLPVEGCRMTTLAARAAVTKQAMSTAVKQCGVWGLVSQEADLSDKRASRVQFTALGLEWRAAFARAARAAESSFAERIGQDVATVTALGLETWVADGMGQAQE
jgi:DNA-binding MarR family transcriptional regulator